MFEDLSNTYKHTVRYPPKNRFAETLSLMQRDINEVSGLSEVERRNYLLQITGQKTSLCPLITMPNQWLVYFHYAAESALAWWHNHYYGFPQSCLYLAPDFASHQPPLPFPSGSRVRPPSSESPRGLSPPAAPRSVREPLDSYGSRDVRPLLERLCPVHRLLLFPVGQ
jgi:hypothetical protein